MHGSRSRNGASTTIPASHRTTALPTSQAIEEGEGNQEELERHHSLCIFIFIFIFILIFTRLPEDGRLLEVVDSHKEFAISLEELVERQMAVAVNIERPELPRQIPLGAAAAVMEFDSCVRVPKLHEQLPHQARDVWHADQRAPYDIWRASGTHGRNFRLAFRAGADLRPAAQGRYLAHDIWQRRHCHRTARQVRTASLHDVRERLLQVILDVVTTLHENLQVFGPLKRGGPQRRLELLFLDAAIAILVEARHVHIDNEVVPRQVPHHLVRLLDGDVVARVLAHE
mmetsp:Transcript_77762/g.202603  ORF Transcript_77762/g.202603 Transcript_77762/m.202603 type:complete len:285 (+) Transcript_77762:140-994(+)